MENGNGRRWKVWVETCNEPGKQYTNAARYNTKEEAEEAARDLMSRWLLVTDWSVREEEDAAA